MTRLLQGNLSFRRGTWALLATAALALPATAQMRAGGLGTTPVDPDSAVKQFLADFGEDLHVEWNFDTGYPNFIYGHAMDLGATPTEDAEYESLSRYLVDAYQEMFGFDSSVLELDQVKHLDFLENIGTTKKVAVVFKQSVDGMPVSNASVSMLFDHNGDLISIANDALPNVAGVDLIPSIPQSEAIRLAERHFGHLGALILDTEMLITPSRDKSRPVLAWTIELRGPEINGMPVQEVITVNARTGRVIRNETTVHSLVDLTGFVKGWGTPGLLPDKSSNPEQQFGLYWVNVSSSAGNDETDANGDWVIPYSGTTNVTVTADFGSDNRYAWVLNDTGGNSSRSKSATPGATTKLKFNNQKRQKKAAEVNCHRGLTHYREWIRSIDPTDNLMDFRTTCRVNINSSCNAFFDGSSINFYTSGSGCVNTCYSTVIAHEQGHYANVIYSSGNGGDGFGEGNADIWAMYSYDTPIVGQDFCGTNCNIRTGNNTRQYCGSCGAGCYSGVHANGEVLMGGGWKVRANLNATHGDATGDLIADSIFLAWMQAYNNTTICSNIRTRWLILDDNDSDIDNGTPNDSDIDDGFAAQGFPNYY